MSAAADLVAQLAAAGTPPELLAAVAQELFAAEHERRALAERKERDRARKASQRSREVTGSHVTERDVTGQPVTPAFEVSPENPLPKTTPSPPYKPPASQRRGTRLADDFEPPEDWIAWAMKKRGWSREEAADECECFVRYWQAKPGREACKLDWPKTWQNWAVNSRRQPRQQAPPVGAWDGMA